MAGVDIFGLFPNSRMAAAVKSGLSQIRSVEGVEIPATYNSAATVANVATGTNVAIIAGASGGNTSGILTLNTAGARTTAQLLALASLTHGFASLSFGINQVGSAGVMIAQGAGFAIYQQGAQISFSTVTVATNPVTITLGTNDVVYVLYSGI